MTPRELARHREIERQVKEETARRELAEHIAIEAEVRAIPAVTAEMIKAESDNARRTGDRRRADLLSSRAMHDISNERHAKAKPIAYRGLDGKGTPVSKDDVEYAKLRGQALGDMSEYNRLSAEMQVEVTLEGKAKEWAAKAPGEWAPARPWGPPAKHVEPLPGDGYTAPGPVSPEAIRSAAADAVRTGNWDGYNKLAERALNEVDAGIPAPVTARSSEGAAPSAARIDFRDRRPA